VQEDLDLLSDITFLKPYPKGLHSPKVGFFNLSNMETFRVVCVNDRFKPSEIPGNLWIKKNEVYTVVDSKMLAKQHMSIGYKLAEIVLPEDCPYQFFIANRFKPYNDEDYMMSLAVEELLTADVEDYA